MGLFDLFKTKKHRSIYGGGNGESFDTAVIIHTSDTMIGVPAEYQYIIAKHGQKDIGWTLESQGVMEKNGRNYDRIIIKLNNGESKSYYFDITQFFGKF